MLMRKMTDEYYRTRELPPRGVGNEHKRRKVRKGTQSCWECKRKKTKCTFATPTDIFCHGCKRRGVPCISQEFPEDPASHRSQLGDRLGRVEELVGQLITDKSKGTPTQNSSPVPQNVSSDALGEHRCSTGQGNVSCSDGQAIASPEVDGSVSLSRHGQEAVPLLRPSLIANTINLGRDTRTTDRYDELSRTLLGTWPNQHDRDLILSRGVGCPGLFHGVICMPYSRLMRQEGPSPKDILQIPQSGLHPVFIARKLLMLGIYLQGFPSAKVQELNDLNTPYHDIMHSAVETASRLVTSNDDMVGTIEGIECIMMETMYQNNAGNLRRAYLTIRRAMVIAQMLGLDRGANSPLLKILEPETRIRIDPEIMWFRIIQGDRYLALMLGLPQATRDNGFANAKVLEGCSPIERMERLGCAVGGRIIELNYANMHDLTVRQEIDKLLLDAAASMPPQWWLAPDLSSKAGDDLEAIQDTIRLMNQFAHYHMLARLHIPYLLHPSTDAKYIYSKITAVMASRELLSRYVPFRSSQNFGSFCRGVDFLAFIASTALCLAHIDARRQKMGHADENGALLSFLSHQRLSDRGMMERVLDTMEHMARTSADRIAAKIARITRHLLAIEANVAMGVSYRTDSSHNAGDEELECNGEISDGGAVLRIYIPHIGTIRIERDGISRTITAVPMSRLTLSSDPLVSFDSPPLSEQPVEHEQDEISPEDQPFHWLAHGNDAFGFDGSAAPDAQVFDPALDLRDERDLQGVDMAFFDSLFRFCGAE